MTPQPHLPPEVFAAIARHVGCRVLTMSTWSSAVPGRAGVSYELTCPTHRHKVALLDMLAWWDAKHDTALREVALSLVRDFGSKPASLARGLHWFVKRSVQFVREPRETFQDAYITLYLGAGDCDDHARLVVALARQLGLRARLGLLFRPGRRDDCGEPIPTHVAAQVREGGRWRWLETTLDALYGEPPRAARRRLAARRGDIG